MRSILRQWAVLMTVSFAFAFGLPVLAVAAEPTAEPISIVSLEGEVTVLADSVERSVRPGEELQLPATIRTGDNGSIELRQGATNISIAADTRVEIPATAVRGDLMERVVQAEGNVFYSVGKRTVKKLRVETPHLVAVIKGTEFNVAVQGDNTSISLFEGRLEVRAPDGSAAVDLKAGEIALRRQTDKTISVVPMEKDESAEQRSQDYDERAARVFQARHLPGADAKLATAGVLDEVDTGAVALDTSLIDARVEVDGGTAEAGLSTDIDIGGSSVGLSADVGLGTGEIDAGVGGALDVGGLSADLDADVGADLGLGTVDAGAEAGIDLGVAEVDVGLDAGVDLDAGTVDLGADAGLDAGVADVDLGLDAGADLDAGTVDLGTDASLDLGGDLDVDAGVDAGIDLGDGSIDLGTDLTAGETNIDLGTEVDLGSGDVAVDTSLGDVDLGLDIDLGGGEIDLDLGTVDDGGGLLGGLLGGEPAPDPDSGETGGSGGGLLGGLLGGG